MATDTLEIFGTEYTGVTGIKATDDNNQTKTYIRPQGTKNITSSGTTDVTAYANVSVPTAVPYVSADTGQFFIDPDSGTKKYRYRGFLAVDESEGDTAGYIADGTTLYGDWIERYAVPSGTTITPSSSAQTVGDSLFVLEAPITISAMPSLTLPTSASASATSGYTSKATISPSTSDQYINIGTGYNGTNSYYKISAMTTMTLPTAAAASATSGYTSKATIGRSTSAQYINIPPGYNSAGAYYVISAVANGSATGPSSLSGSSATVTTGTNTLTLTKTGVTTTPTVSAGYVASATASTATVALTASVTTKAAAIITPGTTNQTIASGTYLTGTQTILGDANLVAGNIISGKTIFGVAGSVVLQNVYTGSSAPSSSTGSNGDIYIQS